MSVSNTWNNWDVDAPTPSPLPSLAERAEPTAPNADAVAPRVPRPTRWSLVSADGRATMRVPTRFVVGSGACCDLRLAEHGIAAHHAMLNVEDEFAYVTPMSDAPTLLDGEAISGRQRLRRNSALTFGTATFSVQHDGPVDEADVEVEADAEVETDDEVEADVEFEAEPRVNEPAARQRMVAADVPTAKPHRAPPPHVSPRIRRDPRAARVATRRSGAAGWFAWAMVAATIAAIVWLAPPDLLEQIGLNRSTVSSVSPALPTPSEARHTASPAPSSLPAAKPRPPPPERGAVVESATVPVAAPDAPVSAPVQTPLGSPVQAPIASSVQPPATARLPEEQAPRAEPAAPASQAVDAQSPDTRADEGAATLLSEADALEAKGNRVTPAGKNAAAYYVRVLQADPDSQLARTRLDRIVSDVARETGDMMLRQRFDGARRSLEQLSVAIPESRRALVGQAARDDWRVAQLLLQADSLMQQFRLVGPDDPNAVDILREALRIDPNNAIADEMLSKAYGLQAERQKQPS